MTKQSKQRKGQRNKSLPGFMAFAAITVSSSGPLLVDISLLVEGADTEILPQHDVLGSGVTRK